MWRDGRGQELAPPTRDISCDRYFVTPSVARARPLASGLPSMTPVSYQPPSFMYPLGTDGVGRSVLAVLAHSTLLTCVSVVLAVAIATIIGVTVGVIAASSRSRWARLVCESAMTLSYSTPLLLAILLVLAVTGDRFWVFPVVAGSIGWGGIALAAHTSVAEVMRSPYVVAADALGATFVRNLRMHILPNAAPTILAAAVAALSPMMQLSVLLAFIGVGRSGLGALIRQGYDVFPSCWWLWVPASIVCIVLLCSVAGITHLISQRGR